MTLRVLEEKVPLRAANDRLHKKVTLLKFFLSIICLLPHRLHDAVLNMVGGLSNVPIWV